MANPAPTINQINAFNATQGTVIDFNIIGGTELVRSNKIYIYDLSNNSLICTHLYPSTESIHELPPNNDASMIYASGKSSADFVNNKQYYAQIQTFTNTGGTEGGSGVSVAKLFWCLPNPSLAFDPIDPQISTTTYNATATYDSNITSENVTVPNIVQQYQFDLYTGAGALVESSGVIVGNGTQIGTTTQWTLTYNFSNLVVGSSYYFKVNVLTTEGMELSAQSGTFTVDIATPTMDKATVSNDACNGYISVTSNLSSEYEHSASGDDILTFETESVNDVSSLKVELNPKQDGTPWIASSDETAPYLLRQSGSGNVGHSFNRENDTLVGGSVAWNQSVEDDVAYHEASGAIASFDDGVVGNLRKCEVTLEPIQDLSNGDPSPTNICPISGRSSVGVTGCGKNLFDKSKSVVEGKLVSATGEISVNSAYAYTDYYTKVKPNTQYVFSGQIVSLGVYNSVAFYDKTKTFISRYLPSSGGTPSSFTTPNNCEYIRFNMANTNNRNGDTIQLELGSTATTYEAYNGTTHTIPLGQTVYGGDVEVVDGKLFKTEEWGYITFDGSDDENWGQSGNQGFYIHLDSLIKSSDYTSFIMCDKLKTFDYSNSSVYKTSADGITGYYDQNGSYPSQNWIYAKAQGISTKNDFETWLSNNPISVCYKKETATPVSITPTQISCLLGQNNIFSDSGDINVTYPTNHSYQSLNTTHKYYTKLNGTETISVGSNIVANVGTDMVVDLTLMFGSTIADYVYGLEQATSGSGVAWLKGYGFFTNSRYGYNSGELVSVNASEHVMRGFNAWDEQWEVGGINSSTGINVVWAGTLRSKNYTPVLPNTTYYFRCNGWGTNTNVKTRFYDADKNYIGFVQKNGSVVAPNSVFTTPSNCHFMRFEFADTYGTTTYHSDICINISKTTGSPKNGDYVPYVYHTYPLADIQLRGIPQLNANNKLTYNGDEYRADGGVTRNYGIVDLGTLTWSQNGTETQFFASLPTGAKSSYVTNHVCEKYVASERGAYDGGLDKTISVTTTRVWVRDSSYSSPSAFKSAMSGVYLIYEKATSTSEQTTPFESPQQVDQYGTEEYIDTRSVPIPVGHKTRYSDEYPVYGWDEVEVFARGVNQWDEEWEVGTIGDNGVPVASTNTIRAKNYISVKPNTTYYLKNGFATNIYLHAYDVNKNWISLLVNGSYDRTFTTPSNCRFILFRCNSSYGTTYNHDISINYPSTDTSYHAYQGATYTKTLPNYDQLLAQNKVPYVTKRVGSDYADVLSEDIVGGTVAWNQLLQNFANPPWSVGTEVSISNNEVAFTPTATWAGTQITGVSVIAGHKYYISVVGRLNSSGTNVKVGSGFIGNTLTIGTLTTTANTEIAKIVSPANSGTGALNLANRVGVADFYLSKPQLFDLTQLFGSTIADYIYTLEQTTQGAGVQWFKSLFPDDYYPYNAGELKSVNVGAHNILDEHMNVVESYPLDSSLTLRGIPKLDTNNKLYYDGDVYSASGSVSRNWAEVDLGALQWTGTSPYGNVHRASVSFPLAVEGTSTTVSPIVSDKYTPSYYITDNAGNATANLIGVRYSTLFATFSNEMTSTQVVNAMSGSQLVYKLKTPTTETATPFESRQSITPYGYEQYCVTSNNELVPTFVPVGHDTKYYATKIFGGEVDLVSGVVKLTQKCIDLGTLTWQQGANNIFNAEISDKKDVTVVTDRLKGLRCSIYPFSTAVSIDANMDNHSMINASTRVFIRNTDYSTTSVFQTAMNGVQLVYELETPIYIHMSPEQIQTLVGENNMWTNGDSLSLDYNIPVTALLVKRQDTSNPSGTWLTLYMKPVTQADDMDFTYIDFLNQYGKTYKYALVPLLRQKQGDVDVEIEGGYTLSNAVDSVFDGVFIADADMSQRVKAGASYGNVTTNQSVGALTPIGAQYPVIITNSHNRYDSGSISGYILPNDFYSTGNLSRTDIVKKYNEIKQFLTNKKSKVIKDWNGNIWLTMMLDNIDCTFDNNYGMGMITFSANWVQVGDATNQEDLQSTGLVNVGGV